MNKLRGLRDIPSVTRPGQSGRMHAEYEYEILNELAQLSREKVWLNKEKKKWQDRIDGIDARLREIKKQEESLRRQMAPEEKTVLDVQDAKQATGNDERTMIVKY